MRIISFVNQKGGVGKTTSVANLGKAFSDMGKKVLVIDLDSQRNLSIAFGLQRLDKDDLTSYEVLKGADINKAIHHSDVDIVPTDVRLAGAEIELVNVRNRETILRKALSRLKEKYDVVLLDCSSHLGIITLNALTASDSVIVPLKADYYSLTGLDYLLETVEIVKKNLNPNLEVSGIIATFYQATRNLDKQTISFVEKNLPGLLFETKITQNTAIAEAPATGSSVLDYDKRSRGAQLYKQLALEIIEREGI